MATIEARSVMYANQMGESQRLQAQDLTAEKATIDLGFFDVDDIGRLLTSQAPRRGKVREDRKAGLRRKGAANGRVYFRGRPWASKRRT
jgi:hypothetical protein